MGTLLYEIHVMLHVDWKERIARADPCIFTYMDG